MNLEKFIITNINSKEFLMSLSKNNKNSFGVRILKPKALALEALNRNNTTIDNEVISNTKQVFVIYNILKDIDYFKSSTFKDAKNITKAINYSRMLCRTNEEEKLNDVLSNGEFKEKNISLLKVYKEYKKYLKDNNLIDDIDIINFAINSNVSINSSCYLFKEDKLNPLEEELVNKVFKEIKTLSILEYAQVDKKELSDITYTNAYGSVNEVEHVLDYIAENKLNYDSCLITLIDPSNISHILNYKNEYNIPITFGVGLPVTLFNGGKLLNELYKWDSNYNGVDAFRELINSYEFDDEKLFSDVKSYDKELIIKTIGNLRINTNFDLKTLEDYKSVITDDEELGRYETVKKISEEFGKGYSYIIRTYTKVDNDLDQSVINSICSYIDEYTNNISNPNLLDIKEELFSLVSRKELSKEGHLHITDLKGSLGVIRKHNFIMGLGAKVFPGAPKENYLLLDSDLERFNEENIKTSVNKINDNKELLFNVLDLHNSLDSKIYLSYSGFNLSELKEENPSSLLFEIFKKENGDDSTIDELNNRVGKQVRYFTSNISSLKDLGNKYIEGKDVKEEEPITEEYTTINYNSNLSPSAAEKYLNCPKQFYLRSLLKIKELEEDDVFNPLPANNEGTLIHSCLEDLVNNPKMTFDEFMSNADKKIEDFFKTRKPVHTETINIIKNRYLTIVKAGYEKGLEESEAEFKVKPYKDKESNISIYGTIDRIDKKDNKYKIIDYKTGKNVKHEEDDVITCFQVLLYAYILEKEYGKEIEGCEYKYLRVHRTVTSVYNDSIKTQLKNKLMEIRDTLNSGEFYTNESRKTCRYCSYKNICGRDEAEAAKD